MRALLVGDVHGNDRFFAKMCSVAVRENCAGIIQLGDFGYWEHYKEGKGFLKWVERQLRDRDLWCQWLDGNHENHPLLWETYGNNPEEMSHVRERLWYMPRGFRFQLGGLSCMAVGGGYSIDKPYRTVDKSWWSTETITQEDFENAVSGGPVDVIFSHDCPWMVDIPTLRGLEKDVFPESRINRQLLGEIVKDTTPKLLVHGHYHCRYDSAYHYRTVDGEHTTQIVGLGADMDPDDAWIVLDTELWPTL